MNDAGAVTGALADRHSQLDRLLQPGSIAVVGASADPMSPSGRPLDFLRQHGWDGELYPVNPSRSTISGLPAYPSLGAIPGPVDLAAVLVPAAKVAEVLADCKEKGVRHAVVFSSGFAEAGPDGAVLEKQIRGFTADGALRVLGPNCEGLLTVGGRMALTFSPVLDREATGRVPEPGPVAVISQSGGLGFALLDHGMRRGLGFSHVITSGNEADIGLVELCEEVLRDPMTRVVVLLIEGIADRVGFARCAAQARSAGKHILVGKLGASIAGCRSTTFHTGHDSGRMDEYEALFRRLDVWHSADPEQLLDRATALMGRLRMRGDRVGVVTSSGGAGIWLADACEAVGFQLPVLSPATQRSLESLMPYYGSARNPVDITAQAVWDSGCARALRAVGTSGEVDAVVLATSMTSARRLERERDQLKELVVDCPVPVLAYSYTHPSAAAISLLREVGICWYASPARTARALRTLRDTT